MLRLFACGLLMSGSLLVAAEPKAVEPKAVEPKAVEPKAVEPKAVEPKAVEPKAVEPKAVEPKAVEPKAVEPKAVEPKAVEPKAVEPKAVEPKAVEPKAAALTAPEDWTGETIAIPPEFAPDMKLKGTEHIKFAPGMMKPASDSFFCYAFVFELQPQPAVTEAVVKDEFLKYYRGLCKAVLRGKLPDVDPSAFKLELQLVKSDTEPASDPKAADKPAAYTGTLDWVEPFATRKSQKLNLEIQTWARNDRNYIFACVSPQARDAAIWKQLHAIRNDYLKK